MLPNCKLTLGIALLLLGDTPGLLTAADLPADHPIRDIKKITGRDLSLRDRHARDLEWSLKLKKHKCYVGEVVWASITVKNTTEHYAYYLALPYHGNCVSTISVWVSKQLSDKKSKQEQWSELKQLIWEDKGRHFPRTHTYLGGYYQGHRFLLRPQQEYSSWSPVNVALQQSFSKRTSFWWPGIGFSEPGKYRFYIRYIDTGALVGGGRPSNAAEFDQSGDEKLRRLPSKSDIKPGVIIDNRSLPAKPVILGPVDVEIVPLPETTAELTESVAKLQKYLAVVERRNNKPVLDEITNSLKGVPETLEAVRGPLGNPEYNLRWPLEFMVLRQGFMPDFRIPFNPKAQEKRQTNSDDPAYNRYLNNLDALRSHLKADDPLREHIDYSRCRVLLSMERTAEAVALAKKLNTPDALVFLDDIKYGTRKKNKKQKSE